MTARIRVLVVDDSATVRKTLSDILGSDPQIEVIGTAADPLLAAEFMKREVPDVITLDLEMPRMNGLTFLDRLMSQHPLPVVVCSTHTQDGSELALTALDKGAVEIIAKPRFGTAEFLRESAIRICDAVKAAAQARPRRRGSSASRPAAKLSADAMLAPPDSMRPVLPATETVVVIGASTGGPAALTSLLGALPATTPGIVVVQHMPEKFTASFAARLNQLCEIEVREAKDGDIVRPGLALIAPGSFHVLLKRQATRYFVEVKTGPLVCRHRPSVDVLFRSAARYAGSNAIGVLLTGMGDDGAKGMLEMKNFGAFNIAQDQSTCVVFGMPNEAHKLGGVHTLLPLHQIAAEIVRRSHR